MKKYTFELAVLIFMMLCVASCGVKTKSTGSGQSGIVQIFTKGKDSLLCFAGPVVYKAIGSNDHFEIDHTYLKVTNHSNPVVCNFSLITRDSKMKPSKVQLNLDEKIFEVGELTKLFAEGKGKKDFIYRYSFEVSDSLFYQWIKCESPIIKVNDRSFGGSKSYKKDANVIFRKILFDLY